MINEIENIDDFLTALRRQLKPLAPPEREEILRELEARLRDSIEKKGLSMSDILQRFGNPRNIANQYVDALLLRKAAASWSPFLLLRVMFRLAFRGIFGSVACLCVVLGYGLGSVFVLSALMKPILPDRTGVWVDDGHLIVTGFQLYPPQPPVHEVMGWWFIPAALMLGAAFLVLTTISAHTVLRSLMRPHSAKTA